MGNLKLLQTLQLLDKFFLKTIPNNIFTLFKHFVHFNIPDCSMFFCEICVLQCESKSGYNKHVRTKHEKEEKNVYSVIITTNCSTTTKN